MKKKNRRQSGGENDFIDFNSQDPCKERHEADEGRGEEKSGET